VDILPVHACAVNYRSSAGSIRIPIAANASAGHVTT
jgi:hypothetical protein